MLEPLWPAVPGLVRTERPLAAPADPDWRGAPFALEPRLEHLRETIQACSRTSVRMTGSGSCLFSLFDNELEAEAWRERVHLVADEPVWVFLAKTT